MTFSSNWRPSWSSIQLVWIVLLAFSYVTTGLFIFSLHSISTVVTPQFFIPEALSLALSLRYGRPMVLGVALGQFWLALISGVSVLQSAGLGVSNGLEVLLAIWLVQRLGLDLSFKNQRDYWFFSLMVVFILQPFSASLGLLVLGHVPGLGGSDWRQFSYLFGNWWVGNCLAQTQLAPFFLWLLPFRPSTVEWRSQLRWLTWALPLLFFGLIFCAYSGSFIFDDFRKVMPFFIMLPLTAFVALRAPSFGPFCLYTSLLAFFVMLAAGMRFGNILMAPEAVGVLGVRLLALCGISQLINMSMIQLTTAVNLSRGRAEQLSRQLKISLLAASLTHEVKQPVSAIQLATQHLLNSPGKDTDEMLNCIIQSAEEINSSTARVYSLMSSIRAELHPIDLRIVVQTSLLQHHARLQEAQVQLQLSCLEGSYLIEGVPYQISLALSNLFRNSLEALQSLAEDQPRLLLVALSKSLSYVELTVGDNGLGFPVDNWTPELFLTSKASGSGLGLYLVQQMADNHNAKLSFGRSGAGGAQVSLRFPIS